MRPFDAKKPWRPATAAWSQDTRLRGRDKQRMQNLLHQQMWCWGRDVVAVPENLLLRYGFTCQRCKNANSQGGSQYSFEVSESLTLYLWAFGVIIQGSSGQSIFQGRYDRTPWLLPAKWSPLHIHQAEEITIGFRPRSMDDRIRVARLMIKLCNWVSTYEQWVCRVRGDNYRTNTLKRWEHPIVAGNQMASAWLELSSRYRKSISTLPLSSNYFT